MDTRSLGKDIDPPRYEDVIRNNNSYVSYTNDDTPIAIILRPSLAAADHTPTDLENSEDVGTWLTFYSALIASFLFPIVSLIIYYSKLKHIAAARYGGFIGLILFWLVLCVSLMRAYIHSPVLIVICNCFLGFCIFFIINLFLKFYKKKIINNYSQRN